MNIRSSYTNKERVKRMKKIEYIIPHFYQIFVLTVFLPDNCNFSSLTSAWFITNHLYWWTHTVHIFDYFNFLFSANSKTLTAIWYFSKFEFIDSGSWIKRLEPFWEKKNSTASVQHALVINSYSLRCFDSLSLVAKRPRKKQQKYHLHLFHFSTMFWDTVAFSCVGIGIREITKSEQKIDCRKRYLMPRHEFTASAWSRFKMTEREHFFNTRSKQLKRAVNNTLSPKEAEHLHDQTGRELTFNLLIAK